jgi:hypothetical protein
MNNTDIIKGFKANTLTEKLLVTHLLTNLASDFYVYMCVIEKQERLPEAALIKTLRDSIFSLRNKNDITYKEIYEGLLNVIERFDIQVTMLKSNPQNAWESHLFQALTNDLVMAMHFFKDNS